MLRHAKPGYIVGHGQLRPGVVADGGQEASEFSEAFLLCALGSSFIETVILNTHHPMIAFV